MRYVVSLAWVIHSLQVRDDGSADSLSKPYGDCVPYQAGN